MQANNEDQNKQELSAIRFVFDRYQSTWDSELHARVKILDGPIIGPIAYSAWWMPDKEVYGLSMLGFLKLCPLVG